MFDETFFSIDNLHKGVTFGWSHSLSSSVCSKLSIPRMLHRVILYHSMFFPDVFVSRALFTKIETCFDNFDDSSKKNISIAMENKLLWK